MDVSDSTRRPVGTIGFAVEIRNPSYVLAMASVCAVFGFALAALGLVGRHSHSDVFNYAIFVAPLFGVQFAFALASHTRIHK